jgi:hypothetical protein
MEPEKKNAKQKMQELLNQNYEIGSVASFTDCTGMMYAPPVSEEELDSYSEINLMPKPSGISKTYRKD